MQQAIDAYLDLLTTCVLVVFPTGYDWSGLDLHGRAGGNQDLDGVEYRDADGNVLLRHTLPG